MVPAEQPVSSYADLLALLTADEVAHQASPALHEVLIPTTLDGVEAVAALRWQAEEGLLQILQSLPLQPAPGLEDALTDALNRLNYSMPAPGFGQNPATGAAYYRLALPLRQGRQLPAGALRQLFSAAVRNAADLLPALQQVASGAIPASGVVEAATVSLAARARGVPTA